MVFYAGEPGKTQISVFTDRRYQIMARNDRHTRRRAGKRDKLDVPIKFFVCYASNTLINQHGDIAHTHEVLQDATV